MKLNLVKILLLLMLIQSNIYCQINSFNIASLTTEDGLSNNHVTAVLEDSKGFIWIATYDGLNRWNGYEFETFKRNNNDLNSLPGNFIISLAEDHSKNIWIGTNNSGLVRYNDAEEKFYRYGVIAGDERSLPGNIVRCITVDASGNVWIGTSLGLAKYDPVKDNFKRFHFPIGMLLESTVDVRRILTIADQELVIQNSLGLFNLNVKNELIQKAGYEFPSYTEKMFTQNEPICFDSDHNLWVGSREGLIKYNTKTGKFKEYKNNEAHSNSISSNTFSVIVEDSKKNIWIGTSNRGVNRYNRSTDDFTVIKEDSHTRNGLTNNIITGIYEDRNSNIWLSTQEGGANYFNDRSRQFEYYNYNYLDNHSVSSNKIGVIHEDDNGDVWIGTKDGGLNKFLKDKKVFKRYVINTKFVSPSILGIENQAKHSLFVTGWEMGLYTFNTTTGRSYNLMENVEIENKPLSINIKGIKLDSKGNLWLATHEKSGILVYDTHSKKFYSAAVPGPYDRDLLRVEYAASFLEDRKKRLWISSYVGVFVFDSVLHSFRHRPNDPHSLSSGYTFDLHEDRHGNIWVGNANGLDKISEKNGRFKVERYSERYPLPGNIKGILEDDHGNLWLSSNQEISTFDPGTGKIKQYTIGQEMPDQEFYERSRFKSSKGEMYFGGINGFVRFHPDSVMVGEIKPNVYIVDFQLFNKSQKVNDPNSPLTKTIAETESITLRHDQSVFTFEFAGLNFNPYQQLEYAYKMEGFDDQWYFVGDKRFATYTNLPSGNYNFRVQLAENNVLQNVGTSMRIIIHPPFWKTTWAYFLYIIVVGLIFYFFRKSILFREKLKNELKLEKIGIKNIMETHLMKLRFFTNVSHEFRTPLTLIKAPIEKLVLTVGQLDKEEQQYHFELIASNTKKLLNLVDQLMDYRKLEAGSLVLEPSMGDIVDFCRRVWSVFNVLANKSNIQYSFNTAVESHIMSFDADKLDKIISNLLSNAFKNTQEYGCISLTIERKYSSTDDMEGYIHITIEDNGFGISKNDLPHIFERFYSVPKNGSSEIKGTGIGLALSKELAELHKGEITVESNEGEGATFKLILPFDNKMISNRQIALVKDDDHERINAHVEAQIEGTKKAEKHRILIVEDDDDLRLFLQKELLASFEVFLASDGKDGLNKVLSEVPDIIISDITMPQMDGIEFCKKIKSDQRTSHIPLILLTARHSQEKQLEGFNSGADDFIIKPFSVEILKSRINNLLHSRSELINRFKNSKELIFDVESIEDKDKNLIQSIIDIVLAHIEDEKINADFIADRVNMSRSLVYRKIEALTGQSVNEFIRNIRLKKSTQLLLNSSKNINEVAYAVGFSSPSYFTRSFIKQFGVSPKEFVKRNRIGV
jgi:signal transduction histidine kinase/ligand-binding sensor domain-containing protein/DNA-binding response OmpR family regulator